MTDAEVEAGGVAALRTKSDPEVVPPRAVDPGSGSTVDGEPHRRRRPLLTGAAVAVIAFVGIGIALVLADRDASTDPAGSPTRSVSRLKIVSLPSLSYSSAEYTAEPGLVEIEFVSEGTHTLTFADPSLAEFALSSSGNRPSRGTVELEPGRDYVIQDAVPGHVQAGERAVIHVTGG